MKSIESIIKNLNQILEAMNILEFKGYNQCKTYTNIVEALQNTIYLTDNLSAEVEEVKASAINEWIEKDENNKNKTLKEENKDKQ